MHTYIHAHMPKQNKHTQSFSCGFGMPVRHTSHIHTYRWGILCFFSLAYIHTYMHTYIHTYIHTHMHTYIHIHTYIQIGHPVVSVSVAGGGIELIHTYIRTHTHTYIHTYIHTDWISCGFCVCSRRRHRALTGAILGKRYVCMFVCVYVLNIYKNRTYSQQGISEMNCCMHMYILMHAVVWMCVCVGSAALSSRMSDSRQHVCMYFYVYLCMSVYVCKYACICIQ
jgi:hypothetical protein